VAGGQSGTATAEQRRSVVIDAFAAPKTIALEGFGSSHESFAKAL